MKFSLRNPLCVFGLVLLWRVLLLFFTAQPIPANDAFFYDGPVVNWLRHGHYFNPAIADVFPISGGQVFSAYPPGYQVVLLLWMSVFGTSVVSAMTLHLALFAVSGFLVLTIVKRFFPPGTHYVIAALLFCGITFGDRPDDLAHALGLGSLLLIERNLAGNGAWKTASGVTILMLTALFTSPVGGAFYFGIGLMTVALAWLNHRKIIVFLPFAVTAAMFATIVLTITRLEPLWWQGFRENARLQSVVTTGFHLPRPLELIKLIRNAPVFLLALGLVPIALARWKELANDTWMRLTAGIFLAGSGLLVADMTLLAPNYVGYVLFSQILLAAGLLALVEKYFPARHSQFQLLILGCAVLVSVRAAGMTTWGAVCAWKNSYHQTHEVLRVELTFFANTNAPVVISSPFLYSAFEFGVQRPVHSDWYYDRALTNASAGFNGFVRLRPSKLVLSQFDYYRAFVPLLERLRQHPELVAVRVRNLAQVRPPDAIPALSRVVQHISWAPVIVDMDWKNPPTP